MPPDRPSQRSAPLYTAPDHPGPEPEAAHTTEPEADASAAWLLRLWGVVAVFAAITVVRSFQIGIPLRDPHRAIFLSRTALSLGVFAACGGVVALWRATHRRS